LSIDTVNYEITSLISQKQKIVLLGSSTTQTVEHYFYEKYPSHSIQSPSKISRRIHDPFAPRRPDNLRASKRSFVRYVLCAIKTFGPPCILTLTYSQPQDSARHGFNDLRLFIMRLRKSEFRISYIAVPEFQKSGRLHFHVLVWGLPSDFPDRRSSSHGVIYGKERSSRIIAKHWGLGYIDLIATDGSDKLSSYLAKYFTKAYNDPRLIGCRLFHRSRDIPKPFIYNGAHIDSLVSIPSPDKIKSHYTYQSRFFGKITKLTYERYL